MPEISLWQLSNSRMCVWVWNPYTEGALWSAYTGRVLYTHIYIHTYTHFVFPTDMGVLCKAPIQIGLCKAPGGFINTCIHSYTSQSLPASYTHMHTSAPNHRGCFERIYKAPIQRVISQAPYREVFVKSHTEGRFPELLRPLGGFMKPSYRGAFTKHLSALHTQKCS